MRRPRDQWLGPLDGLLRFRCTSCGRTFNALTKTPMAHLRKKKRWLDHAQAMIEGKSLAKTAELCGVHPTTAFRWRHRFLRAPADDKPRTLSGIVEADETFILESFKGRWSNLSRKARKRGGTARHPGSYQDNLPVLVARDRKGATFDAVLPQDDGACRRRADGRRYARKSSRRGWRQAVGRLRAQGQNSLSRRAFAGKADRRGRLTCTSITSTPTTAASSNGSTASMASPPRTCQAISAGDAPSKPGANTSIRQNGSAALSATGHTNR